LTVRIARPLLAAVSASIVLTGILAAGEDAKSPSPYAGNVAIESKHLKRRFVPNGDVSKTEWAKAKWALFNHNYLGTEEYPEVETEVASLWTKDHIYFAYRAHYTALNFYAGEDPAKERWKLWERDVVEVFLNPRPEHLNIYYEFEVAPNNQWLDLDIDLDRKPYTNESWDSGFEHATRVDEKAKVWTCEFRIPLASMKVAAIKPGETWRLNFFRMDGKEQGPKPRHLMSWSSITPPHNGYHTPKYFGIVRFVK
jgi:alpha-galactosidase